MSTLLDTAPTGYSGPVPTPRESRVFDADAQIWFVGWPEPDVMEQRGLPLAAWLAIQCRKSEGCRVPAAWAIAAFEEIWVRGGLGAFDRQGRHWGHLLPPEEGIGVKWLTILLSASELNFRCV
jgi:hypothetical protein